MCLCGLFCVVCSVCLFVLFVRFVRFVWLFLRFVWFVFFHVSFIFVCLFLLFIFACFYACIYRQSLCVLFARQRARPAPAYMTSTLPSLQHHALVLALPLDRIPSPPQAHALTLSAISSSSTLLDLVLSPAYLRCMSSPSPSPSPSSRPLDHMCSPSPSRSYRPLDLPLNGMPSPSPSPSPSRPHDLKYVCVTTTIT